MNTGARLTTLTRLGFAVRGALYIVIALLILRTGRAEDPAGALAYLGEGGGRLLLVLMAAGLTAGSSRQTERARGRTRRSVANGSTARTVTRRGPEVKSDATGSGEMGVGFKVLGAECSVLRNL